MLFEIPLVELLVRTWRLRGPELPAGPVVWCCWHGDLPAAFRLLRDIGGKSARGEYQRK